ncbi:hypothetical protein [Chelatococcus reniformis]|uniref:Uncharacterized protein n=1 Tax=Chelatococcus reniformis TaxID=1494448 RepID=A0A916UW13_9HYPH|nr:hypothetical protein [Chelatococcus reniformis]GGC90697.1 hypothetical protein GCM10010994_55620 [Chelatococcus reniformis]
MKQVTLTKYRAFDGRDFDSADECRAHERANSSGALVGLTLEQVEAAIVRTDASLADAIEEVAKRITRARLDAGERRRRPRGQAAADGATPEIVDAVSGEITKGPDELIDGVPANV